MKINKELMKGSTVILILTMLDQKPMYGYEMIKAIELQSGGVFEFKEGTVYPILHTLETEGLLESHWSDGVGDRKRKYYEITLKGQNQLISKKKEWVIFSSTIDQVIRGGRYENGHAL